MNPAPEGRYDLCVLATQPPNVEDAARTALPHLAEDAREVINRKICEAVWAIARGEQRSSREVLDRICEPEEPVTAAAPPPPS